MAKNRTTKADQAARSVAALWAGIDDAVSYYRPRIIEAMANSALEHATAKEA